MHLSYFENDFYHENDLIDSKFTYVEVQISTKLLHSNPTTTS